MIEAGLGRQRSVMNSTSVRGRAAALVFVSLVSLPATAAAEGRVAVAAAADLKFALDEIVQAFAKKRPDITVAVTYWSSGNFYAQLSRGGPFDVFFSADVEYT